MSSQATDNMNRHTTIQHRSDARVTRVMASPVPNPQLFERWLPVTIAKVRSPDVLSIAIRQDQVGPNRHCNLLTLKKCLVYRISHRNCSVRIPLRRTNKDFTPQFRRLAFDLDSAVFKINISPLEPEHFSLPQSTHKRKQESSIQVVRSPELQDAMHFRFCEGLDIRFRLGWSIYPPQWIRGDYLVLHCLRHCRRQCAERPHASRCTYSTGQQSGKPLLNHFVSQFVNLVRFQVRLNVVFARQLVPVQSRLREALGVSPQPCVKIITQQNLRFITTRIGYRFSGCQAGLDLNQFLPGFLSTFGGPRNLLSGSIRLSDTDLTVPPIFRLSEEHASITVGPFSAFLLWHYVSQSLQKSPLFSRTSDFQTSKQPYHYPSIEGYASLGTFLDSLPLQQPKINHSDIENQVSPPATSELHLTRRAISVTSSSQTKFFPWQGNFGNAPIRRWRAATLQRFFRARPHTIASRMNATGAWLNGGGRHSGMPKRPVLQRELRQLRTAVRSFSTG